ncbi:MAG: glutathione S-transferase family protein [Rhodocyclaceae bacterium]|nr:glutathione S-transferase family protein [Rhodocyclaceae bacterium]
MSNSTYTLYGWHLSYFTGKVLCYLNYKQIPFVHRDVDMATLMWRIKRKVGAVVMPVLVTPEQQWIDDSSRIIDYLEQRFPDASVVPPTPVQRFASYLMEAWGDEWWVPIAMHTRWSYPENYALFEREAGSALLPKLPAFVQRRAVAKVAATLRGMLHTVGVRAEQFAVMDQWTTGMLDLLEQHFARHSYLFGERPTIGDFGLVGTMYGHLGRDPWPARELIAPRPCLRAWIARMAKAPIQTHAVLLTDDAIADTLSPVFRAIFAEFIPLLDGINQQVKAALPALPPDRALPRGLADVEVPMGAGRFRRKALPYTLWMAQRAKDVYQQMSADEQQSVRDWLTPLGGASLLALNVPRLKLHGLRVTPDQNSLPAR